MKVVCPCCNQELELSVKVAPKLVLEKDGSVSIEEYSLKDAWLKPVKPC